MLVFSVWWVDLEFHRLPLKLKKKEREWRICYAPPCVFQEKTLTHYWHLCVWGVKCYITQRSEKSKRLEAAMESEGEFFFPLARRKLKALRPKRKCIVFSHSDEELRGENSCRKTFEACSQAVWCAGVWMCVCVRKTSSSNNKKKKNKPCEYEKMWSLFNISTHISNIHIYIFCTMNISLVCNLSGLLKASRLCHKYIIHSAIWSLCTRVSLLYMSHECVTNSTCMNQKQNHKSLKLLFCEEQFRLSWVSPIWCLKQMRENN